MIQKPKTEEISSGEDLKSNSEPPKKKRKDRRVEKEYFDWIEVKDPTSGTLIRQKVKITKYKTRGARFIKPAVEEEELGYEYTTEDED